MGSKLDLASSALLLSLFLARSMNLISGSIAKSVFFGGDGSGLCQWPDPFYCSTVDSAKLPVTKYSFQIDLAKCTTGERPAQMKVCQSSLGLQKHTTIS